MYFILAITVSFMSTLSLAFAVEPQEVLEDAELEGRARAISQNLRCLVCQNESIDESNAPLAADLRVLVREQLVKGLSDNEIYQYVTDRYGEFVLLRPDASGSNLVIYLAGPILLLLSLFGAATYVFKRQASRPTKQSPLSEEEQQLVNKLIGNDSS